MKHRGFTLLELLITMAIVAVLAALAWPGYAAVVQRAQRNDARLALLAIQHAQERHYQSFNRYSDALEGAGTAGGLGLDPRSTNGSYVLTLASSEDGQHYMATARTDRSGRQGADADCVLFSIDETGRHTAMDARGADNTAACWR